MRRYFHHLIPSMFHRRLLLLALLAMVVLAALGLQTYRLTMIQGELFRREAERAMVSRRLIPTIRGRILDRNNRVLAQDRPTYDVAVEYGTILERWSYAKARRKAYKASPSRWSELDFASREKLIAEFRPQYDQQVEDFWQSLCKLGNIDRAELEDRKAGIVRRVQQIASDVWLRQLQELKQKHGDDNDELDLSDVANPISEEHAAHPLLFDVDDKTLLIIKRNIAAAQERAVELRQSGSVGINEIEIWTQVSVQPSRQREYPMETLTPVVDRINLPSPLRADKATPITVHGVAMHQIGLMRDIWEEDVDRRPFMRPTISDEDAMDLGGYLSGDRAGAWGLERSMEDWLRGKRGQEKEMLDTRSRAREEPQPGRDLKLSLDVQLQARVQAIMDPRLGLMEVQSWYYHDPPSDPAVPQIGDPLNGAAIVMDVPTGQVLAAVSVPSLSLSLLREHPGAIWDDRINQPFLNRTIAMPYQPGSTVKPMVLCGAMTDRKLGINEEITCNGLLDPKHPFQLRCWIYKQSFGTKTHGPLAGPEAIARSCNIFFETVGRRLGGNRLVWWYDQFGVGQPTDCGLDEEVAGDLPKITAKDGSPTEISADVAMNMGIGQGPIQWTPLQAASAYAAIARGGYWKSPTFFTDPDSVGHPQNDRDLHLDPNSVDQAISGMSQAINANYGTGNHIRVNGAQSELTFDIQGVKLMGKSGTADAVPLRLVPDEEFKKTRRTRVTSSDPIVRRGDHAWMIVMVQRPGDSRPRYVVAVVVEYGGSGGAAAGPVANQILHAMRLEGYL